MSSSLERVVITGSTGVVGGVITEGLSAEFKVTPIARRYGPEHDLRDYSNVLKIMEGHQAIVHLAWNKRDQNFNPIDDADGESIDPSNILMASNIYRAAVELKPKGRIRVIMASSVAADDLFGWKKGDGLMRADTVPTPYSQYGASKVWIEAAGRYHAKYHDIEVACLRFGAVRKNNLPPRGEEAFWLSNEDCISAVRACLVAETIPQNYALFYVVSNNPGRYHDLSNTVGWQPQLNS